MANQKISQLSNGNPPQSADQIPINRAGSNFSITAGNLSGIASTAGQGYFIGPGLITVGESFSNGAALVSSAQQVVVTQFTLPISITVRNVTYAATVTVASSTITFGIYSADGNTKLLDSGTFNGGSSSNQTLAVTAVTLPPAVYWFAQSASTQTTLTGPGIAGNGIVNGFLIAHAAHMGTAANSATAGVLPATLGVITGSSIVPAVPLFET